MQRKEPSESDRERESHAFNIGEELCVWMKAGVVNFKLCHGSHDCANCAFDRAMSEAYGAQRKD